MKQKVRNLDHLGPRAARRGATPLELCLVNDTHKLVYVGTDLVCGVVVETWRCRACGTEDLVRNEPDRDW